MANRRELIAELIEDKEFNAESLLDSLIAAMSEHVVLDALEYVARIEEWEVRLSDDRSRWTRLWGHHTTGAHDHNTDNFMLTAQHDREAKAMIDAGKPDIDIIKKIKTTADPENEIDIDCDLDWSCINEYFQILREESKR